MANVSKPDLERGAYIVYTDEPGEVLSPGSSGGGGVVVIEGIATDANIEMQASYNDLYEHFNNGEICFLHIVNDQFSLYGMMLISAIQHSENYSAFVVWSISGGTLTNAEFKADNATGNFVFSMGG